jgi:hypothetical protein
MYALYAFQERDEMRTSWRAPGRKLFFSQEENIYLREKNSFLQVEKIVLMKI